MRWVILWSWAVWAGLLSGCVNFDAPHRPGDDEVVVFEVSPGSSASGLTEQLVAGQFVAGELQWKWFLRQADAGCVKAGKHALKRSMSMNELLAALCAAPIPEDEPFTVVEGWRIRDIDAALAAKGWIASGAYLKAATNKAVKLPFDVDQPTLEGYLFPDTYRVEPKKFTVEGFIERQLGTFQERFLARQKDKLGKRSLHDVVVMASMIEREEPSKANRPIVAGILWKRIDNAWFLGVDATSRYTLADWNDREAFLVRLRDPADVYNTRLRLGMPPTAIGNPGIESLEAAIAPKESDFWYYLHDGTGTLHGGRNATEHEANRAKFNVY